MSQPGVAVRGVLLDIDGTLIDSNDAHARSWADTLCRAGYQVTFQRVRELIGKGGDKLLAETVGLDDESPEGKEITRRRRDLFLREYVPTLRAFDGARELLIHMRKEGLLLVVATSAGADEMGPLLRVVGAEDLIDEATSSSDAERSKPDPDIVQAALAKGQLAPHEALMLGDTPYDVEAASRAGVGAIALRTGGWPDEALSGALAIFDGPRDLLERWDQSPLRRARSLR